MCAGSDVLEPVIGAVRDQHKSSGEYFLKVQKLKYPDDSYCSLFPLFVLLVCCFFIQLQTALSIWTQEISTDLPESDGSF